MQIGPKMATLQEKNQKCTLKTFFLKNPPGFWTFETSSWILRSNHFWSELIYWNINFVLKCFPAHCGLNSASTNKSFNLYYFRFLAVKRQIQHQQETRKQGQIQGKLRNWVYYLHNFSNIPFCLNADSLQRKMISGYA